jgi:uncharacterized protein YqgC (DUF456 family)
MWSLLGSLIGNFLLLRDLFGYAIPGAVLLAIADYIERPDLANLPLINDSVWIKLVAAVTASYVVGHVLAAIGYTLYYLIGLIIWPLQYRMRTSSRFHTSNTSILPYSLSPTAVKRKLFCASTRRWRFWLLPAFGSDCTSALGLRNNWPFPAMERLPFGQYGASVLQFGAGSGAACRRKITSRSSGGAATTPRAATLHRAFLARRACGLGL